MSTSEDISIVEEFLDFFNNLLNGYTPEDEDENNEVLNIIQSESTMESISLKLNTVFKKLTNTIEQNVYADQKITIDCGRGKLTDWHLKPMGQKFTWYGSEIPNTKCIKYGCCYDVTQMTLKEVFYQLGTQGVDIKGILLKPNMVLSGKSAKNRALPPEVGKWTVDCFKSVLLEAAVLAAKTCPVVLSFLIGSYEIPESSNPILGNVIATDSSTPLSPLPLRNRRIHLSLGPYAIGTFICSFITSLASLRTTLISLNIVPNIATYFLIV